VLLAVAAGYAAEKLLLGHYGLSVIAFACRSGMALAVLSVFQRQPRKTQSMNHLSAFGLCVYAVLTDEAEVLMAGDTLSLLVAIAWLSPVIVGGLLLPRRGAWLAGLGCWLVLFSGVAALTYSVSHSNSGKSFFHGMMS
jgi:hypothetical protein